MSQHRRVTILGVTVDSLPLDKTLETMQRTIANEQRAIMTYVNVHAMNMAYEKPRFRHFLNNAALTFCDGQGVRLGAKLLGKEIDYRYTPPDWIDDLCALCVEQGYSLYLLGAEGDVTERAATMLQEKHPGLQIAGTYHGYFDKQKDSAESQAIVERVNAANPDILLLGFGMPKQEYWLEDHWEALTVRVAMPVGAMFDYVVGDVYRAPRWVTDNGFEWLARLVVEPRRLWKRYVVGNPLFIWRVLTVGNRSKSGL